MDDDRYRPTQDEVEGAVLADAWNVTFCPDCKCLHIYLLDGDDMVIAYGNVQVSEFAEMCKHIDEQIQSEKRKLQ
jgi:hypothetical protein